MHTMQPKLFFTLMIALINTNNEPVSVFSINVVSGDSDCSVVNIFLIDALLYIDTEDLLTDEALFRCSGSLFFCTRTFAGISIRLSVTHSSTIQ